ncbi:response regulator [Flavobacterium sp. SUN052]|uniref:response regulator n=1 Tax=Flavobacterium sp. SUN052 TaxID=3002441 RepID=UPI00237E81BC|nr:response regulator [Flavobacterium sp. SUN052]MEC4004350.1 response regulator [Flavobacterium sp. SUN052]
MEHSKKIYYLDDDLDDLGFFKEIADDLGFDVTLFLDGRIMLQTLADDEDKPAIIILDIHMPVLNGEEILAIIRKDTNLKDIPIAMISGAYPKKLVKHYNEMGVKYLVKRHNFKEFKEAIESVLDEMLANSKV